MPASASLAAPVPAPREGGHRHPGRTSPPGFLVRFWLGALAVAFSVASTTSQAEAPAATPAVPEKVVAMDFLGSCASYLTFVAPLLQKHQFHATFCVDDPTVNRRGTSLDAHAAMTWADIGNLSTWGFEIGNATPSSLEPLEYKSKARILQEIESVENRCTENGIPKPVTLTYPGGFACSAALQFLADKGYRLAVEYRSGLTYQPANDHPLLVPGLWLYGRAGEREKFYRLWDSLPPGQIPVLCFDGIDTPWGGTKKELFAEYVKYLADHQFTVISLGELAARVNSGEAMRAARPWRTSGHEHALATAAASRNSLPPGPITALQTQLESLVLAKVDAEDASLESILTLLKQKAITASASRIQLGFAVDPKLDLSVPVTLHLVNVPFMEVLRYLADLAHAEFAVDAYAISAKPKTSSSAAFTPKTPCPPQQRQQFEEVLVPEIDFRGVPLKDALQTLEARAGQRAGGWDALNFVVAPAVDSSVPVRLRLANVPVAEVLRYLADLAGVDFELDRYAISVHPQVARRPPKTVKTPASAAQMQQLESLIMPRVEFQDATLHSALQHLSKIAATASSGRVAPSFVIYPSVGESKTITLSLANTPLKEVLRYIGDVAGVELTAEKYAVSVEAKMPAAKSPAPPPFVLVK